MVASVMRLCEFRGGYCVTCGARQVNPRQACGDYKVPDEPPLTQQPELMLARDAPGFLEKVKNFATAAAKHVAAGMPMASDEEIMRRHDICLGCEHLQNNACNLCGCPVSRVAGYVSKLSWADQECPVGKWGTAGLP